MELLCFHAGSWPRYHRRPSEAVALGALALLLPAQLPAPRQVAPAPLFAWAALRCAGVDVDLPTRVGAGWWRDVRWEQAPGDEWIEHS